MNHRSGDKNKTIILLEESRKYGLRLGEEFLEMIPKSWSLKGNWLHRNKNIQSAKNTGQWKDKL